ncbi:hypothetical protein CRG98_038588 [Punica granatum]|uniref:Uncharacterized protein n=1 Tax=Punica granatum TaxID=22663 RepID=A0A2I0IBM5_PUNGR|nr:hypothetical protein CRG98_038588 [Punica granatum]
MECNSPLRPQCYTIKTQQSKKLIKGYPTSVFFIFLNSFLQNCWQAFHHLLHLITIGDLHAKDSRLFTNREHRSTASPSNSPVLLLKDSYSHIKMVFFSSVLPYKKLSLSHNSSAVLQAYTILKTLSSIERYSKFMALVLCIRWFSVWLDTAKFMAAVLLLEGFPSEIMLH